MVRTCLAAFTSCTLLAGASAQELADGGPSGGRVAWYRADQGLVKSFSDLVRGWADLSGRGGDLFCNAPESFPEWSAVELNGQPALRFDGNDWLFGSGMPTGSYTKVVVCRIDDFDSSNNVVSSQSHHALWFGATKRARMFHGGDFVTSGHDAKAGVPIVLVATFDASTGIGELWQDGLWVGNGQTSSANWDTTLMLGAFGFGNFMKGAIGEVMVYDHVLTPFERNELHGYLRRRYVDTPAAKVEWIERPRPGQVLQRDAQGQAPLHLKGRVASPGFTDVEIEVSRDGVPWYTKSKPLTYGSNGKAWFGFSPALFAGKHDHDVAVYVKDATRRELVAQIPAVTVGDLYVVHGQSNAQAGDYWGEGLANESQSRWLRSFGSSTIYGATPFDLHWDKADGLASFSHGAIGQWAIRMGEVLVQNEHLPIAIVNGAVGGTSVWQHQRNDADPLDPSTIYGRLLLRMVESGAADSFRAMLWYQGESDAGDPTGWYNGWLALRADWAADYPGIERVYVVQIRNDCGYGGQAVQEIQRSLADSTSDTTVMSTTAIPAHDGCHYQYAGYRDLGEKMARLLRRDFFGSTDTQEIDPPNPLSATWGPIRRYSVTITFRDADDVLVLEKGAPSNFVTDLGERPVIGSVSGNTVTLNFSSRVDGRTIGYEGHPYDGPWLKNARGVGALCFQGLPFR